MATEVLVPPLGQTVDTVTLISWYKQEGAPVAQGETLFAIETDKATLDIEAPASGILCRVTALPGDVIRVLTPIGIIAAPDESPEELLPGTRPEAAHTMAQSPGTRIQAHRDSKAQGPPRIFISPRARRLAEKHGVPLDELTPSGPEGAIVERDVRALLETRPEPAITPVARRVAEQANLAWQSLSGSGPGGRIMRGDVDRALDEASPLKEKVLETIPLAGVRAVIAERMLHSTISTAPVTLNAEVEAEALVDLRNHFREDGIDIAYNDLLLAILAKALREHPRLNASLQDKSIKLWKRIHIGLAVDTDRGLLVPVIRDADRKSLVDLSKETRLLTERARAGHCTPEELQGGTFTLTNLGMFGIDSFTPIINQPECAILGAGRIKKQAVIIGDRAVARSRMWLSLTFDHRLVDGAPAARFLQRVVQLVERPHLLMA